MNSIPLDLLDDFPRPMRRYLKYYGWHFNRKAYEYAASLMWKEDNGKKQRVPVMTKEETDTLLRENGVEVTNKGNYDYVYWAMQCRADLMPQAIEDAKHHAQYVKSMADDPDITPEATFRKWYCCAIGSGTAIPFEDFLE